MKIPRIHIPRWPLAAFILFSTSVCLAPSFATAQFNFQIKKERREDFDLWLGEVTQMRERLGIRLKPDLQLIEESLPDFDDFYLYTQRSPAPKIWFGRINKRDGSPLLLLWIGFCTRVMTECLDELGSTLYPSIYFDLISPNSYGKSWGPAPDLSGGRFTIDELNVGVPTRGESRCEVRFLNKESLKNFGLDKRFKRGSQVDIQNFNLDQVLNYLVKDIQKLTDRDGEILT